MRLKLLQKEQSKKQEIPKQIPKERYTPPEERQKLIIGCLTLFKAFLPTTYFN